MRTLHLIDSLGAGGAERSLAELVARLPDHGIDPTVVVLRRASEGFHEEVAAGGTPVHVVGASSAPTRVPEIRRLIRTTGADVVHTTLYESDVLGRLAGLGEVPVLSSLVSTSYGLERLADPNVSTLKLRAAQAVDAVTARATTHFHAITDAVKQAAVHDLLVSPDRITVVPRGRDRTRLGEPGRARREVTRARLGIPEETPLVLNVARQEFAKGQVHVLDAALRLRSTRPEVRWLIAGRRGNATSSLQRHYHDLGLEDSVWFLGHRGDVPDLLCAADVFVFPSLYEGMGGALLEAMALELPVVASDVPALREVLDDGRTGWLVAPGDAADLATTVETALADRPTAQAQAAAARERFEQHYRFDVVLQDMASLFHSVAG